MTGRWFRFYDGVLNDPKVQKLPAPLFKTWVNLLCLAAQSQESGLLPETTEDIAFALRMEPEQCRRDLDTLHTAGLIEVAPESGRECVHNWQERQYNKPSDAPEATRERKRHQRERDRTEEGERAENGVPPLSRPCHAPVTPPYSDTDSEAETEAEQKDPPTGVPPPVPETIASVTAAPVVSVPKASSHAFKAPTEEECSLYFAERKHPDLSERFWNYWESVGWMRGGKKMRDWRAAVREWIAKEPDRPRPSPALPRGRASPPAPSTLEEHRDRTLSWITET